MFPSYRRLWRLRRSLRKLNISKLQLIAQTIAGTLQPPMILHLSSKVVYNEGLYEFFAPKICLFRAKDVTLRHKIKSIHTTRVSVSIEGGSFQHFMEGSVVVFTWIVLKTLAVDALIPYSFCFKIALTMIKTFVRDTSYIWLNAISRITL